MNLNKKYRLVETDGDCYCCCFVNKDSGSCGIKVVVDVKKINTQVGDCTDVWDSHYEEIEEMEVNNDNQKG